jgi:hypothetical protein
MVNKPGFFLDNFHYNWGSTSRAEKPGFSWISFIIPKVLCVSLKTKVS